jgi:hypothetical protein
MAKKRHSAEEVINKLRQADVELGKGNTVAGVCRLLGVTEPTYPEVLEVVRDHPGSDARNVLAYLEGEWAEE